MDKAVVLLSGGLDSTVLLYSLLEKYECFPLTINYGQRHSKEISAAKAVCEACSKDLLERWKFVDLGALKNFLPSTLTGAGEVPEGHYADPVMKQTIVPGRNMILLAISAGYAQGIDAKYVAYAAHAGDHPIYPDCRPEFIDSVRNTISLGTGWKHDGVYLLAPFVNKTKADVVKLGAKLCVPFQLTYSCYKGEKKHCRKCGTCVERAEAFRLAGVLDPTEYE